MARTYTITVTDDETGVVIFAGRPTGHMLMVLESDRAGRLVCDRCESPVAEDLAGMDAEGPTDSDDDSESEDGTVPKCQHCGLWIWDSQGGGEWEAYGTTAPSRCPESRYGHAPRNQ